MDMIRHYDIGQQIISFSIKVLKGRGYYSPLLWQ